MEIRTAKIEDAAEILKIYAPYVEKTAITFEYDVPTLEEFKRRIENTLKNYPYLVAEDKGEILGYCYCSPFKEREAYKYSVETTIYIREDSKGRGIGKLLYEKLEEILKRQNITNLNACIGSCEIEDETLTNDSTRFHEHMGYKLVGEFHNCGYKFGRWYNMLWMEKFILDHLDAPGDFIPYGEL